MIGGLELSRVSNTRFAASVGQAARDADFPARTADVAGQLDDVVLGLSLSGRQHHLGQSGYRFVVRVSSSSPTNPTS